MNRSILLIAGASVGLFVGLLVGLSVSPVVATVVSALVGVVTAFCTATLGGGLKAALEPPSPGRRADPSTDAHIYLAAFSAVGVIAVLAGIYIRTHNLLSPSPREIVAEWRAAGFSEEDARKIAAHTYVNAAGSAAASRSADSVLIGKDADDCNLVEGQVFRQEWGYAEGFFQNHGGKWQAELDRIKTMPDEQRHAAIAAFVHQQCDGGAR